MSEQMRQAEFADALVRYAPDYHVTLTPAQLTALARYYAILERWNPRLHLVAPCAPAEFACRHVLESLFAASSINQNAIVVDVGSGGGLPALPLSILRADLHLMLIEANGKKCVFLREAATEIGCAPRTEIINKRFEQHTPPASAATTTVLTCRALDRFAGLLPKLLAWSAQAKLLLLFGGDDLRYHLEDELFAVNDLRIPHSERRFLFVLRRGSA